MNFPNTIPLNRRGSLSLLLKATFPDQTSSLSLKLLQSHYLQWSPFCRQYSTHIISHCDPFAGKLLYLTCELLQYLSLRSRLLTIFLLPKSNWLITPILNSCVLNFKKNKRFNFIITYHKGIIKLLNIPILYSIYPYHMLYSYFILFSPSYKTFLSCIDCLPTSLRQLRRRQVHTASPTIYLQVPSESCYSGWAILLLAKSSVSICVANIFLSQLIKKVTSKTIIYCIPLFFLPIEFYTEDR